MIKNHYYLIVGVLCVLFAVTHTLNGISTNLQILGGSAIEHSAKTAFTYVWHIIGIENLVFGTALLLMAFQKKPSRVKFVAWLIIMILALRWIVIAAFTLSSQTGHVMQILPDTIAILASITLLILGTKRKDTICNHLTQQ